MKRIKLILLACTAIFCSCEDWLTRVPQDSMTPEMFFKSEVECELYTNDFYTLLPSTGIYSETADYIIPMELSESVLGTRTVPASESQWNWDKLRDINFFLERSHQCEDPLVRAEYDGVARFFRAYFYFEKVKRYGDVPWVDKTLDADSEELYKGRDSREVVMQNILKDIDYAIENLPSKRNTFKVTKWTALALKSRIFLFEGTFRKYHGIEDWEKYLTESASAAEIFMKQSGYTLYKTGSTPYKSLFVLNDSDQTEVVLSRIYNVSLGLKHDVNGRFTSISQGRPGIAKDVVNMYLMNNGDRFTSKEGWETMGFVEECQDRDPRLAQTIRTPGYIREGGSALVAPNMAATMTGYQIIKYVGEEKYDSYNSSENDLPVIRTAEVYLNYAEAKAELGTLTQSDIESTVNKLRSRVGMKGMLDMGEANKNPDPYLLYDPETHTGYPNVTGDNQGVILEIRRERTIELMAEGHRYYDIMRWKAGKRFERQFYGMYFAGVGQYDLDGNGKPDFELYDGDKPAEEEGVVYMSLDEAKLSEGSKGYITCHDQTKDGARQREWREDRDYLYPVPTKDRILTNGAITQNPNWDDGLSF